MREGIRLWTQATWIGVALFGSFALVPLGLLMLIGEGPFLGLGALEPLFGLLALALSPVLAGLSFRRMGRDKL